MEKQLADLRIEEYFQKIYGFAVKKTYSMEEAEELCAEMVKEVYVSLLKMKEVVNVEGYVYRICENTFAKYVSSKKKKQGVSIDGMEIPVYDQYDLGESEEELIRLTREIAFLSQKRRRIVYAFYYEGKAISDIAMEMDLPEGTVKWHLNKARNELKEGFTMERKIGKLGLSPIEAFGFGHSGDPGNGNGPEKFLSDKINLNLVYSVYETPRTKEEMAEELGMTPVFLDERIATLEENGFLVKTAKDKYTTYVKFNPKTVSIEAGENVLKMKVKVVDKLLSDYIPKVREAVKNYVMDSNKDSNKDCDTNFNKVYIPSGNFQLFEAAAIFYAVANKCIIPIQKNLEAYRIRPFGGGDYIAMVENKFEISDPDYKPSLPENFKDYGFCGDMTRMSEKYEGVYSWSVDSRFSGRKGGWENNLTEDYEYIYELMQGSISDTPANAEKFNRLRERGFITSDNKVNIMVVKDSFEKFVEMIPALHKEIIDEVADFALEQAMQNAKNFPPQMQDYVVWKSVTSFIGGMEAMMILDKLYENGTFAPLTEQDKISSQLLMFSDILPQ